MDFIRNNGHWQLPTLAALLMFAPILAADFVYDDLVLLRDNQAMSSWSLIWDSFTRPMWELIEDQRAHSGGFFRPIGTSSFCLLWHLGGGSALPFHLASWILNAACAGLLASLALKLGWRTGSAMIAGILFAVHGAHTEPVAWASSLTYLLACFFSLLALRSLAANNTTRCACWLLLAMLSQESALGTWALSLAICLSLPGQDWRLRFRGAATLLIPLAVVWLLRANAFESLLAGLDRRITWFGFELRDQPLLEEAALSMQLVADYLRFLLWPWPHAPFHPLRIEYGINDIQRWLPALCGLVATVAALGIWLWRGRRSPAVLFGLGLMFAGLAPLMKTSSLGQFPFEERFLYLPSAGFALLLSGLVSTRWLTGLLLFAAANAWSGISTLGHWQTEEKLFTWARASSPNAMMSWNESGRILLQQAQALPAEDQRHLQLAFAAERAFTTGLKLDPDIWFISAIDRHNGNVGLANALMVEGDYQTATATFRQIIERWPKSAEANAGLGFCLVTQAEQDLLAGLETESFEQLGEALYHFNLALEEAPHLLEVVYGKGITLGLLERIDESVPYLEQAFESRPADFRYAQALASAHFETKRFLFAQRTWERHLEIVPDSPARSEIERTIKVLQEMR